MAWTQDELGNWYNEDPSYTSDWYDDFLTDIGISPGSTSGWTNADSPSNNDILWDMGYFDDVTADYSNEGRNYPTPESTQGSGGSPINASISGSSTGRKASDAFNKRVGLDSSGGASGGSSSGSSRFWKDISGQSGTTAQLASLLPLLAGLAAASKSNTRTQPAGYQGGIPRYTATRQAPAEGQRISGNVTYTKAAEGGELNAGGFVIPADVVSHFGNGSSDAGLKLLSAKLGATPIKGDGDGMSDSIPTTIDGQQKALVAHEEAYLSPEKVAKLGGGDAKKGAKRLRDMMARIRQARTGSEEQGRQINPNKFMPGGEVKRYAAGDSVTAPAGTTGVDQSLAQWAGPYVTDMLAKGQALTEMPYEQYTGRLTAGPSALQTKAFQQASDFAAPASVGQAAQTAGGIAQAAQGLDYTAAGMPSYSPLQPGQVSSSFQAPGAYQAGTFANQYNAPTPYQAGTFGADTFTADQAQQYMNPFLRAALDPQLEEARRQADISRIADAARLTKAGAYGGSRQAIMESEGRRNLATNLANITGQGYTSAYDKAMQQFNADQARRFQSQQLGEQSRQFGAQQGMTAAQLQAQYGLSADQAQEASRQFAAQQGLAAATTAGQQGLQAALANQQAGLTAGQSNINAALQAAQQAEQSRQFGASLGLQGLNTALQGAQTQGQLGIAQGQLGLQGLKNLAELGGTERDIEAQRLAAEKAQFEEARLNPYKMVQYQQALLQGLPLGAYTYNQQPTSNLSQFASGAVTLKKALEALGIKG